MCPVAGGSGSPTIASRMTDLPPSAPMSATPCRLPLSVFKTTCLLSFSKPRPRVLVRSSIIPGSAWQPPSSEPWMSARCVTAYGLPKRRANRATSGILMIFSPLTPSNISRCSMNTACFFTSWPTPSASSACQALGAIWMPAPISPNCGACSRTTERQPFLASASAAARPPMPPPAMSTGSLFLEEDGDAIELAFGVHQVHALVGDLECIPLWTKAVLHESAIDALFLVSKFGQGEGGGNTHLIPRFFQRHDVRNLMNRPGNRIARVRARMPNLLHPQF